MVHVKAWCDIVGCNKIVGCYEIVGCYQTMHIITAVHNNFAIQFKIILLLYVQIIFRQPLVVSFCTPFTNTD